jgi:hypothetical protein
MKTDTSIIRKNDWAARLMEPAASPVLSPYQSLRATLAAHADIGCFAIWDHVQEMRSERATYTNEEASTQEILDAIADLKVRQADALIRRLQAPPPD